MKSTQDIATAVIKRVNLTLLNELPEPSCPVAREQWRWRMEEVKKKVAMYLYPNVGVNVEVKP
jgi:hypothetical protein